jgi:hypothetical protein
MGAGTCVVGPIFDTVFRGYLGIVRQLVNMVVEWQGGLGWGSCAYVLPSPLRVLWLERESPPAPLRRADDEGGRRRIQRLRRFRPPCCIRLHEQYGMFAGPGAQPQRGCGVLTIVDEDAVDIPVEAVEVLG